MTTYEEFIRNLKEIKNSINIFNYDVDVIKLPDLYSNRNFVNKSKDDESSNFGIDINHDKRCKY